LFGNLFGNLFINVFLNLFVNIFVNLFLNLFANVFVKLHEENDVKIKRYEESIDCFTRLVKRFNVWFFYLSYMFIKIGNLFNHFSINLFINFSINKQVNNQVANKQVITRWMQRKKQNQVVHISSREISMLIYLLSCFLTFLLSYL